MALAAGGFGARRPGHAQEDRREGPGCTGGTVTSVEQETETDPHAETATLRRQIEESERRARLLQDRVRDLEQEGQKLSAIVNFTDAGFLVFNSSLQVVWANEIFNQRYTPAVANPASVIGSSCMPIILPASHTDMVKDLVTISLTPFPCHTRRN